MPQYSSSRPLAIVTGASSGIGYELALCCAKNGFDLLIAADKPEIMQAAKAFEASGASVEALQCNLSTFDGVDKLYAAVKGRPVSALLANAGVGLGKGFLDQDVKDWKFLVDTNIVGTLYLIQKAAKDMVAKNQGRILITGSIAGFMPGAFQAVYNGTKAFLDSFAFALRNELKDTGVTVTCLMPGATETDFFARADMLDTKVGAGKKEDPASVAQKGFDAMMNGDAEVISGWMNKMRAAIGLIAPSEKVAEMHRNMAAPGSAKSAA